jgi:hypothetical protein
MRAPNVLNDHEKVFGNSCSVENLDTDRLYERFKDGENDLA